MQYTVQASKQAVREALVDYFRSTADWRRWKAEQYEYDARNSKSAAALDQVADYCLQLADDADVLAKLFAMPYCFTDDGDVFSEPALLGGECRSADVARRCGFHGAESPADFLDDWIATVEEDYPKYVRFICEQAGLSDDEFAED